MEPAEQPDSQLPDSDAHSEGAGGDAAAGEKVKGVASDSGDELDAALAAAAAPRKRGLSSRISDLKESKAALKKERQQILKDLRNAERRRRRLKRKAKELPNDDLMEVLAMRQEERRAPKRSISQSQDTALPRAARRVPSMTMTVASLCLSCPVRSVLCFAHNTVRAP